jgi:hypothetical protein
MDESVMKIKSRPSGKDIETWQPEDESNMKKSEKRLTLMNS